MSPDECAKSSLDMLGYDRETRGHWKHRFLYWIASKLPDIIVNYSAKKAVEKILKTQATHQ